MQRPTQDQTLDDVESLLITAGDLAKRPEMETELTHAWHCILDALSEVRLARDRIQSKDAANRH